MKYLILIGTIVGVCILTFLLFADQTKQYEKEKSKIDSLNAVIVGLEVEQIKQDSLINSYKAYINTLDSGINEQKNKISKTKKEYEQKIQNVNGYTPDELNQFFTDRYN